MSLPFLSSKLEVGWMVLPDFLIFSPPPLSCTVKRNKPPHQFKDDTASLPVACRLSSRHLSRANKANQLIGNGKNSEILYWLVWEEGFTLDSWFEKQTFLKNWISIISCLLLIHWRVFFAELSGIFIFGEYCLNLPNPFHRKPQGQR